MKFQTYQSKLIEDNYQQFLTECERACVKLDDNFPSEDKTWSYYKYNMFVVTAGSKIFYNLFKEMQWCIRNFCQTKEPLWWGCWLNYHESNKVLGPRQWSRFQRNEVSLLSVIFSSRYDSFE